ncbi:MAG: MarR family winged helix-turn-helix transcriptional regulator [Desulfobacula sp.]|nr:MarR family winged helix-turn-helix transcriptional regulator [Desulfobacula sp.]
MVYKIIGAFERVVKLNNEFEKKSHDFGIGDKLYNSEIHMIEVIGENENLSATDIADFFGITKGAVSQTLKKLDKKGLIIKNRAPENASKFILDLTAKGKSVFYEHLHWHETMDNGFKKAFYGMDIEILESMAKFLNKFEMFLKKRLNK